MRLGVLLAVILALGFFLPGCVELTGQRISIHYDQEGDVLRILVHHDGIHEASNADEEGKDSLVKLYSDRLRKLRRRLETRFDEIESFDSERSTTEAPR